MKRNRIHSGRMVFDTTEEYWFSSWVVMRRLYLKAKEVIEVAYGNNRLLIADIQALRKENDELKKLLNKDQDTINRKAEADRLWAESRRKDIEVFNKKNNKGRNYKAKGHTVNKKRKRMR